MVKLIQLSNIQLFKRFIHFQYLFLKRCVTLVTQIKVMRNYLVVILLGTLLFSCKKDSEAPNFHYDYFPVSFGKYVVYKVREVKIDDALDQDDTLNYYLKTLIGDTIIDNEGRIARRYIRYIRTLPTDSWEFSDFYTTIIVNGRAELVEENQRIIKLVFAPTQYKEWNANAHNTMDALDCYYRDIHLAQTVGANTFDSTLVVEQEDFTSLIDYRRKFEVYAKGIGLVYKHFKDFKINNFDTTDITQGYEINLQAIDFGVE